MLGFGTEDERSESRNKFGRDSLDIQNTISFADVEGTHSSPKVRVKGILKSETGNYVNFTQPSDMDLSWKADTEEQNQAQPYFLSTSRCPTWTARTRPQSGGGRRERDFSSDDFYEDSVPIAMSTLEKGKSQFSSRVTSSLARKILLYTVQLTSLVLITLGIVTLVTSSLPTGSHSVPINSTEALPSIHAALESWLLSPNSSQVSNDDSLLDIPQFFFIMNNASVCESVENGSKGVYLMVLVHSAPDHFVERQAIRMTWGSVRSLQGWAFRLIFLLGQARATEEAWLETQERVLRESETHGDVVLGSFGDTYRNLTYKHLMGYRWATTHCPQAKFLLKTDDDAFVDIFQLFSFAHRTYGSHPSNTLLCNVYPEGTKPVRSDSDEGREGGRKWVVSESEYPFETYPKYCGGLGYLVTPDLAARILTVSRSVQRMFWIDDVFVTGLMRELLLHDPFYLNLRYSYDPKEYRAWLDDRSTTHRLRQIPFMFVHVDRGTSYTEEMSALWRKTLRAWS